MLVQLQELCLTVDEGITEELVQLSHCRQLSLLICNPLLVSIFGVLVTRNHAYLTFIDHSQLLAEGEYGLREDGHVVGQFTHPALVHLEIVLQLLLCAFQFLDGLGVGDSFLFRTESICDTLELSISSAVYSLLNSVRISSTSCCTASNPYASRSSRRARKRVLNSDVVESRFKIYRSSVVSAAPATITAMQTRSSLNIIYIYIEKNDSNTNNFFHFFFLPLAGGLASFFTG